MKNSDTIKHETRNHIKAIEQTVFLRPRRLDSYEYEFTKNQFNKMPRKGISLFDTSNTSPLHLVPKPNNNRFQPNVDFRELNAFTITDHFPVLQIHDFALGLRGSRVFSKIDSANAYYQIPVAEEDVRKTSVSTPFALYEFLPIPLGLRNAAHFFQTLIDEVLR